MTILLFLILNIIYFFLLETLVFLLSDIVEIY